MSISVKHYFVECSTLHAHEFHIHLRLTVRIISVILKFSVERHVATSKVE